MFKVRTRLYHSTLGSRVIKQREEEGQLLSDGKIVDEGQKLSEAQLNMHNFYARDNSTGITFE